MYPPFPSVTMEICTRTNVLKSLPKSSALKLALSAAVGQYHCTHPNSYSAFVTINTPPQCGFMESFIKVAVILARVANLRKEDCGPWELAYMAGGAEVHPGKHWSNDRTYAAYTLAQRRKELKNMLKDMRQSILEVCIM